MLCRKPCMNRGIIVFKTSHIETSSLETDIDPIFLIFQLIYAPESTLIIASVLSLFKNLHAGSIQVMKCFCDDLLILTFQASTASVISMYKTGFRNFFFVAAVTDTVPVYRPLSISPLCGILRCQAPESFTGQIYSIVTMFMYQTATAFHISRL